MGAIDRLRRDHQLLRAKLDVLEATLRLGSEAWYVLREVCWTLSRQLRNHMQREEDVIIACRRALQPHVLAEVALEHHDEPEHLRTINRLFIEERAHDLTKISPVLTAVITGLRRHMAEEEAVLFPALEQAIRQQASSTIVPAQEPALNECMTVNRVMRDYPQTKPIFDRFFINIPMEGCDCLDEVAWRHGMGSETLLAQLNAALPAHQAAVAPMGQEQAVCACQ